MSDKVGAPAEIRAQGRLLFTEQEVAAAYDRLAKEISRDFADKDPVFLAVMCGGLVPTAAILQRIDFPYRLDYVHASRYGRSLQGGDLVWKVEPEQRLRGEAIVIVDDILDAGETLAALKARLSSLGVAEQRVAVLVERNRTRASAGVTADYVGLRVDRGFVFGCGMDAGGYWRGLPSVFVLDDS